MNTLAVCFIALIWVFLFVAAVGVGHRVIETRWRRQAQDRAFDSMVEEYRRQQDAGRTL